MVKRETDSPNWGGIRPGQGRKPTGKQKKTMAFSLPLELTTWLEEEAERRDEPKSRLVAEALEKLKGEAS